MINGSSLYKYYMRMLVMSIGDISEFQETCFHLGIPIYSIKCYQDNSEPWAWSTACASDPRLDFYLIKNSEKLYYIEY